MASPTPLDELQYRRPDIITWHITQNGGQWMDENMIHRYISESPFFDHSTKNGLTIDQARTNMRAYQVVGSRKMFEDELRKRKGDEYLIVGDPQAVKDGGDRKDTGVWIIRKQHRDFGRNAVDGRMEEELTTLGTYYLVGENMYQAPSVGDIVANRLTAATTQLSEFFETAASLPSFSPTSGYSYLPASSSSGGNKAPATTTTAEGSTNASPSRSREGSVVPLPNLGGGVEIQSQSLRSTSLQPPDTHTHTSDSQRQATRLLQLSFQETLQYDGEFMDENPLLGEPGSGNLKFTHTTSAIKARRRREEEAEAAAKAKVAALKAGSQGTTTPKVEKAPSPPAVMTEAKVMGKERKGSKMERVRRKKSRVGSVLVGTPGVETAGANAGGAGG